MTDNTVSLLVVNSATGIAFGAAIVMALDVFKFPKRHWLKIFWGMIFLWFAAIMAASTFATPEDMYIRRWINAVVISLIAVVVISDEYQRNKARKIHRHLRSTPRPMSRPMPSNRMALPDPYHVAEGRKRH